MGMCSLVRYCNQKSCRSSPLHSFQISSSCWNWFAITDGYFFFHLWPCGSLKDHAVSHCHRNDHALQLQQLLIKIPVPNTVWLWVKDYLGFFFLLSPQWLPALFPTTTVTLACSPISFLSVNLILISLSQGSDSAPPPPHHKQVTDLVPLFSSHTHPLSPTIYH